MASNGGVHKPRPKQGVFKCDHVDSSTGKVCGAVFNRKANLGTHRANMHSRQKRLFDFIQYDPFAPVVQGRPRLPAVMGIMTASVGDDQPGRDHIFRSNAHLERDPPKHQPPQCDAGPVLADDIHSEDLQSDGSPASPPPRPLTSPASDSETVDEPTLGLPAVQLLGPRSPSDEAGSVTPPARQASRQWRAGDQDHEDEGVCWPKANGRAHDAGTRVLAPAYDIKHSKKFGIQQRGLDWLTVRAKTHFEQSYRQLLSQWGVTTDHQTTCVLVPEDWRMADPMGLMDRFNGQNFPKQASRAWFCYTDHGTTLIRAACWFAAKEWPRRGIDLDGFISCGSTLR